MNVKRLRNKKRWTGRELGKVLLLITALELDANNNGKPNPPERAELIELFRLHEDDLLSERDRLEYRVYTNLFDGLVNAHNLTAGQQQQFYHGLVKNVHYLDLSYIADKNERVKDTLPLIMTKSEYSRYMDEARERVKTSKEESYFTVFYELLGYYLEDSRRAPAEVKKAITATKTEPATNQRILSTYNRYMKRGYYTLPDGRRSDQTDAKAWKSAVSELFPVQKRVVNGKTLNKAETAEKLREELEADYYERLFYTEKLPLSESDMLFFVTLREKNIEKLRKGEAPTISPEEFNKAESYLYGAGNFPKWDYYTDAPEISKYELLCVCLDEYAGEGKNGKTKVALYKELSADYPALVSAMEALIKKSLPSLSGLTVSHYNKKLITHAELANFPPFEFYASEDVIEKCIVSEIIKETEPDAFTRYRKSNRVYENGVAVIQNPEPGEKDERGDWVDVFALFAVDGLETIGEGSADEIAFNLRNNIMPSARFIYAYNALLDIVGAFYDIEMIDAFKISESRMEARANTFNEYLYRYYGEVYGDEETKARKRELIKEVFEPLNMEALKPSAEELEDVAEFFEAEGMTARGANSVKILYQFVYQIVGY